MLFYQKVSQYLLDQNVSPIQKTLTLKHDIYIYLFVPENQKRIAILFDVLLRLKSLIFYFSDL